MTSSLGVSKKKRIRHFLLNLYRAGVVNEEELSGLPEVHKQYHILSGKPI
jgi:hypothetical protein